MKKKICIKPMKVNVKKDPPKTDKELLKKVLSSTMCKGFLEENNGYKEPIKQIIKLLIFNLWKDHSLIRMYISEDFYTLRLHYENFTIKIHGDARIEIHSEIFGMKRKIFKFLRKNGYDAPIHEFYKEDI